MTRAEAIEAAKLQLKQLAQDCIEQESYQAAHSLIGAVVMCGQAVDQLHEDGNADELYSAPGGANTNEG